MLNLFLVYENFVNGYYDYSLFFISLASILCAILVIVTKNPIISVLYLIGLFLSIALYLIIMGINFIGLSYLLVYIGAVSILFLFILMLINVRISELLTDSNNSTFLVILVTVIGYLTINDIFPFINKVFYYIQNNINLNIHKDFYLANITKPNVINASLFNSEKITNSVNVTNHVSYPSWDGNLLEISHIGSIGNIMYTNYSIWLILTSVILLLAMVGAIVITIKQKNTL